MKTRTDVRQARKLIGDLYAATAPAGWPPHVVAPLAIDTLRALRDEIESLEAAVASGSGLAGAVAEARRVARSYGLGV